MTVDPCEYQQHCAVWGFCEECDPHLYRAMILAEAAIREAGVPDTSQRAVPYAVILQALRAATGRLDNTNTTTTEENLS